MLYEPMEPAATPPSPGGASPARDASSASSGGAAAALSTGGAASSPDVDRGDVAIPGVAARDRLAGVTLVVLDEVHYLSDIDRRAWP